MRIEGDWKTRQLSVADLQRLRRLDRDAFNSWFAPRGKELAIRTGADVRALLDRAPDGSFGVENRAGELLGYVFCRCWGDWGWLGPLGVVPHSQRKGIGSTLVRRAIDYLSTHVRVFGLETMVENLDNVLLYTRLGFRAVSPTLLLEIQAAEVSGQSPELSQRLVVWDELRSAEREKLLESLRVLWGQLVSGLDYSREVLLMRKYGTGHTVLWQSADNRVKGFALVRTVSHRMEETAQPVEVELFGLSPSVDTKRATAFLCSLVTHLGEEQNQTVRLWVPAGWGETLAVCSRIGFRPLRARQRMVHRRGVEEYLQTLNKAAGEGQIHGATWAG